MSRGATALDIITPLSKTEEFEERLKKTDHLLLIADVYKDWAGPCTVMVPIIQRLWKEYDEPDKRMSFVSICVDKLPEAVVESLKDKGFWHESCRPRFLIFKFGQLVVNIDGANAAELKNGVKEHIFPLRDDGF